jgi:hypothetical protein
MKRTLATACVLTALLLITLALVVAASAQEVNRLTVYGPDAMEGVFCDSEADMTRLTKAPKDKVEAIFKDTQCAWIAVIYHVMQPVDRVTRFDGEDAFIVKAQIIGMTAKAENVQKVVDAKKQGRPMDALQHIPMVHLVFRVEVSAGGRKEVKSCP